jgi:tetratricopeptide (TPR) repeat protein
MDRRARLVFHLMAAALGVGCLGGCQSGTVPDPNAVGPALQREPEMMRRNLSDTYLTLAERLQRGQLTPERLDQLLTEEARAMVRGINVESVPREQAWQYGEVFRTAKLWPQTARLFERALKHPTNQGRLVHDSLRYAEALAKLGRIEESIVAAKRSLGTDPKFAVGVLLPVYLEIVPSAEGQGHDAELAELIELAMAEHVRALADPSTPEGRAFVAARPHHLMAASRLAERLYRRAGLPAKAEAVAAHTRKVLQELGEP